MEHPEVCTIISDDDETDDYIHEIPGVKTFGVKRGPSLNSTPELHSFPQFPARKRKRELTSPKVDTIIAGTGSCAARKRLDFEAAEMKCGLSLKAIPTFKRLPFNEWSAKKVVAEVNDSETQVVLFKKLLEEVATIRGQVEEKKSVIEKLEAEKEEMAAQHTKEIEGLGAAAANERQAMQEEWSADAEIMREEMVEKSKKVEDSLRSVFLAEKEQADQERLKSFEDLKEQHRLEIEVLKADASSKEEVISEGWTIQFEQVVGEQERVAKELEFLQTRHREERKEWLTLLRELEQDSKQSREKREGKLRMAEQKLLEGLET